MDGGFRHLIARERLTNNLEPYPAKEGFRRALDRLMYGIGFAAPLALIPQILRIYVDKDVAGLSPITFTLLAAANGLWALYGLLHRESQIFIANALMSLFNIAVIVGILRFQ